METSTIILLLLILTGVANACDNTTLHTIHYLYNFGYLPNRTEADLSDVDVTEFSNALVNLQDYYRLNAHADLDVDTLRVIQTRRCGVPDDVFKFSTKGFKWSKNVLRWHYSLVPAHIVKLAETAFELWSEHSDITFEHDYNNPDITISNQRGLHQYQRSHGYCSYEFDGEHGIVAHAFTPVGDDKPLEIHIDIDENWYTKPDNNTPTEQINLLHTLLHEVGHVLGNGHSEKTDSIMFAMYDKYASRVTLHEDDIAAVQSVYGKKKRRRVPTPPPPTPRQPVHVPAIEPTASPNNVPKLCDIENPHHYLIVNEFMYVIHNLWFWTVNLKDYSYKDTPTSLLDKLTFLPAYTTKIDGVYQRPGGDVVMFANDKIYVMKFPELQLVAGYPRNINSLGLNSTSVINAVFTNYVGRTFVLYTGDQFFEMNDCALQPKSHGFTTKKFTSLPKSLSGAFRYTNGKMYFFKDNTFYEYDEFREIITRAGKYEKSLFGINCQKSATSIVEIAQQIQNLVSKLSSIPVDP